MNTENIISNINHKVCMLLKNSVITIKSFHGHKQAMNYFQASYYTNHSYCPISLVWWKAPDFHCVKINFCGFSIDNGSGVGGIIHDHLGKCIIAFSSPLNVISPMICDLYALLLSIFICRELHFFNLWVETSNLQILSYISEDGKLVAHPDYFYFIRILKQYLNAFSYKLSYIHSEGNKAAYWLANYGIHLSNYTTYNADSLPSYAKGIVKLDMNNMPFIRDDG